LSLYVSDRANKNLAGYRDIMDHRRIERLHNLNCERGIRRRLWVRVDYPNLFCIVILE